jgi:hypothetical protein
MALIPNRQNLSDGIFSGSAKLVPYDAGTANGIGAGMDTRLSNIFDLGKNAANPGRHLNGAPDWVQGFRNVFEHLGHLDDGRLVNTPDPGILDVFFSSSSGFNEPTLPLGGVFAGLDTPAVFTEKDTKWQRDANARCAFKTHLNPSFYPPSLYQSSDDLQRRFRENYFPNFAFVGPIKSTQWGDTGDGLMTIADINNEFHRVANTPRGRFVEHPIFKSAFRNPMEFAKYFVFVGWNGELQSTDAERERVSQFINILRGVTRSYNFWIGCSDAPPVNGAALYLSFVRDEIPRPELTALWKADEDGNNTMTDDVSLFDILPDGLGGCGDPFPTEHEFRGLVIPRYKLKCEVDISAGPADPFVESACGRGYQLPRFKVGRMQRSESGERYAEQQYETRVKQAIDPCMKPQPNLEGVPCVEIHVQESRL